MGCVGRRTQESCFQGCGASALEAEIEGDVGVKAGSWLEAGRADSHSRRAVLGVVGVAARSEDEGFSSLRRSRFGSAGAGTLRPLIAHASTGR